MFDDIAKWLSIGAMLLGWVFTQGRNEQRLSNLEKRSGEDQAKMDKILEIAAEIREQVGELRGRMDSRK